MNVIVNDLPQQYPAALTIADLVQQLGLGGKPVAVEQNGELVPKAQHADTWLHDGDRLEIVSLTGGG